MVWEADARLHKLTVAPVALCFHLPHSHPHHLSPTTSTCHLCITCTCHLPSSPVSIVHTSHLYLSPTTCIPFCSLSPTPVTLHHLPECYGRFNLLVYCMFISCHHLLCYQHHVTGLPRCQHILQWLSPQLCATSALPALVHWQVTPHTSHSKVARSLGRIDIHDADILSPLLPASLQACGPQDCHLGVTK